MLKGRNYIRPLKLVCKQLAYKTYSLIGVSFVAEFLVTLYLSSLKGTKPMSVRYPLFPIALMEVNSFKNSLIPGTTPM